MKKSNDQLTRGLNLLSETAHIHYEYNRRNLIYKRDKLKLYHYAPKRPKTHATPLLVVFATVNRPEILDLFPENSFIGGLLNDGIDVYLLDWGYPDNNDKEITIEDYVGDYLDACVKFICAERKLDKINLLGICQGGVISLCYATLFPRIKNLILISAPIDFQTKDNTISNILRRIEVDKLNALPGNVSGQWLTQFFILMRPFELIGKKYLRFIDNLDNQEFTKKFLRVEKWLNDAPDQTNASFVELVRDFYQGNKLIKGEITIYGRKVDLARLTIPVLNIIAREDEIVPMSASRCLSKYVQSKDYTQKIFSSGHIGIYISDKVGRKMPRAIGNWLKRHGKQQPE